MNRPAQATDSLSDQDSVCYAIDANDCIVHTNAAWDCFAQGNAAPALLGARVRGRRLWEFIADRNTAELYRLLIAEVRKAGQAAHFPYRCDSPALRRFMHMTIEPRADQGVAFCSRLETCEPQNPRAVFLAAARGLTPHTYRCSVCNYVRCSRRWMPVSEAARVEQFMNLDLPVRVAYAVCSACRDTILEGRSHAS